MTWIKKLFSRTDADAPTKEPSQDHEPSVAGMEGMTMEEKLRMLQEKWHDFFDEDPILNAEGGMKRPGELPERFDIDDRLSFGFGMATSATRGKCFGLFPHGAEMHRRFEDYLESPRSQISQDEAKAILAKVLPLFQQVVPEAVVKAENIKFLDEAEEGYRKSIKYADYMGFLVYEVCPSNQLSLFLREPLYVAGESMYYLCEWVTSVSVPEPIAELQELLYRLWLGGWQVLLDPDSVILLKRASG